MQLSSHLTDFSDREILSTDISNGCFFYGENYYVLFGLHFKFVRAKILKRQFKIRVTQAIITYLNLRLINKEMKKKRKEEWSKQWCVFIYVLLGLT